MVLRCSLLGHDYGDPEVEREREERGSEVVVTVQEYEECTRCGERNVISENTEVTSLSETDPDAPTPPADGETAPPTEQTHPNAGADAGFVDADADPAAAEAGTGAEIIDADPDPDDGKADVEIGDAEPAAEADDPGVTIRDAESDEPVGSTPSEPAEAADVAGPSEEDDDADDGVILTDDGPTDDGPIDDGPADREPGEWPESTDVGQPVDGTGEPAEWPGADDDPVTNDAVVLEHTDPAESNDGRDAVATDSEIVDGAPGTGTEPSQPTGSGIERAEPVPTPGDTRRRDDVPTEFYCPRCEFVEPDDRGSLRAGDICPDCRKGYLGERPVQ